jgi:cyclase
VIDAQQNEALARGLIDAVRDAGSDPIRALVNTHFHGDHVFGNPAFPPGIEIVSHARCRAVLAEALRAAGVAEETPLPERQALELAFGADLYDLVSRDDPTWDSFRRRYHGGELAGARIRLPTVTVEGECTFHLGDRRMVLRRFGPGHTDADLVAWFPEDGVIFAADLVFSGRFPWLGGADVPEWIARLEDIASLRPRTVVPGHGEPVTAREVLAFRDLLQTVYDAVGAAAQRGLDEPAAMEQVRLPAYGHLAHYADWLPVGVRKLWRDVQKTGTAREGGSR